MPNPIWGVKWNVLNAQEDIVIGSNDGNHSFIPLNTYNYSSISQQIYTSDQIGQSGTINEISFYRNSGTTHNNRLVDIYMVNTTKSKFASNSDWVSVSDSDKVFSGILNNGNSTNDWFKFTLDEPFEYNGENLLICVNVKNNNQWSNNNSFATFNTNDTRALYASTDNNDYDPINMTGGYALNKLNYIKLNITPAVDDGLEPATPTNLVATADDHNSITLTWDAAENAKKYEIYFTGNKIGETTGTSYVVEGLNAETEYCYTIKSVRYSNYSDESDYACATTLAKPEDPLVGKQFRIKALTYVQKLESYSTYYYGPYEFVDDRYLHIVDNNEAGVRVVGKESGNAQKFTFEPTGIEGQYYLRSADGYYINCGDWNVSAYTEESKSPVEVVYIDDTKTKFYLMNGTGRHFKVETGYYDGQTFKPYCDAIQQYAAKWVVEDVQFQAIATSTGNEIFDDQSTTLNVTAMDGSGNYTYSWSPATGLNDATSANPTFTPTAPGEYTFTCTVTDTESNATTEATVMVNVSARPALTLSVTADKELIYNDDEVAVLTATATQGYALYTYSWTLNETEVGKDAIYNFSSETAGEYTLTCTVTDSRNNVQTASKTITVKDASERPLEIVIGTPVQSNTYNPVSALYENSYSQQIYTSDEINMSACDITSVSFMKYNDIAYPRNIKVFMLNIDKDSFTSKNDWVTTLTESDVVYEGTFDFAGSQGEWTTIEFTNAFSYTGGNILLCVNDYTGGWNNSYPHFYSYNVTSNRSLSARRDNTSFPDVMTITANYCEKNVNHIKFGYEIPAPKPANFVATSTQIYVGETTTLTWDALDGAASYNIYVNGELKGNTEELSYELSGLTYNMNPGHEVEVATVYENDTESGKASVTVQVADVFTLTVNVTNGNGNAIEGAEVTIDMAYAYDEFKNQVAAVEPLTTGADGSVNVTLPKLCQETYTNVNNGQFIYTSYYTIEVSKSPYQSSQYNYINYYDDVTDGYTMDIELNLPTISSVQVEGEEGESLGDVIMAGTTFFLTWDEVEGATSYKVYQQSHLGEIIKTEEVEGNNYEIYAERNIDGVKYGVSVLFDDKESDVVYTELIKVIGEGAIKGIVTDGTNPIADIVVYLEGTSIMGTEIVPDMTTNESGEFEFYVTEGKYTLSISHYDYEEYVMENVEIAYNSTNDLGTITLTAKPEITGVTVTADNNGNVSWTGDYAKYNVYRKNIETPQELETVATAVTTTSATDAQWETLEPGTYQYGVSGFVVGSNIEETVIDENFELGLMPENWIIKSVAADDYANSGTSNWKVGSKFTTSSSDSYLPYEGNYSAYSTGSANDYSSFYLILPIDDAKPTKLSFSYLATDYEGYENDIATLLVSYSNSIDGPWTQVWTSGGVAVKSWTPQTIDLSSIQDSYNYIAFIHVDDYAHGAAIDNVVVKGLPMIETQPVWSNEVEKQGPATFVGGDTENPTAWDVAANWSTGVVPADGAEVTIAANALISSDVNVKNLTINTGASLTVANGGALTVTGTIDQASDYLLVLEEGGQIFQNNPSVTARFRMSIDNPTEWSNTANKDGWQFISMPMTDVYYTDFASKYNPSTGQSTCDYDLYKYDGSQELEWQNHKDGGFVDYYNQAETYFKSGTGYLASRKEVKTVTVYGTLNTSTSFAGYFPYNAEKDLANFRLIGNPFTYDIKWGDMNPFQLADGFAVVDENGGYDYFTGSDATIKVGQGFFIKAIEGDYPNSQYSYTKSRSAKSESCNSINLIATGAEGSDNVIINLAGAENEGFNKLQNFNEGIANIFVAKNDIRYGIANFDSDVTMVDVAFEAKEMGNYTIAAQPEGKFETLTLVDRFTGVETNLLIEDYHFTATSRDDYNRFIVKLKVNGQQSIDNSQFAYQSGEDLILNIEGKVQIIDMMGRIVYSNDVTSANNRINVSDFNNAAYLIRVVNEEGVKVQKLIVNSL